MENKNEKKFWEVSFSSLAMGIKSPVDIVVYHKEGTSENCAGIHISFRGHTITHLFTTEELLFYKKSAIIAGRYSKNKGINCYE